MVASSKLNYLTENEIYILYKFQRLTFAKFHDYYDGKGWLYYDNDNANSRNTTDAIMILCLNAFSTINVTLFLWTMFLV